MLCVWFAIGPFPLWHFPFPEQQLPAASFSPARQVAAATRQIERKVNRQTGLSWTNVLRRASRWRTNALEIC